MPPNGWLVERWKLNQSRNSPPVLVAQFTGNPKNTFWCSDEEMALTTHNPVSLRSTPLDYDITFQVGTLFITSVESGSPTLVPFQMPIPDVL